MTSILAVVSDLMFASRISATARAADIACRCCTGESALRDAINALENTETFSHLLIDMSLPIEAASSLIMKAASRDPKPRIIAFHSHVRADLHQAAKVAGADEIIPNSRLAERLNQIVESSKAN